MKFQIGERAYELVIADRHLYDEEGNQLEGRALEGPRLVVLSRAVEIERRYEVLRHEIQHCWFFHIPKPSSEEESCQLAAFIDEKFHADLDRQGGRDALESMPAQSVPHLGRPAIARPAAQLRDTYGSPDRKVCGNCDSETLCGSIHNGEHFLHEQTGKVRVERWMECDACGIVTHWFEVATADGSPLGELIPNPRPRMLRSADAKAFLADKRKMMELA